MNRCGANPSIRWSCFKHKNDNFNILNFQPKVNTFLTIKDCRIYMDCIFEEEVNYRKYLQSNLNAIMKRINGNWVGFNKIKIMQYNKGSSNFANNIHHIQNIIELHDPHIMCISEANIKKTDIGPLTPTIHGD